MKSGSSTRDLYSGRTTCYERSSFTIGYYCMTEDGVKFYGANFECAGGVWPGIMKFQPYFLEFDSYDKSTGMPALDILGMVVNGLVMLTTGSPTVEFAVYGHTLVGGWELDTVYENS